MFTWPVDYWDMIVICCSDYDIVIDDVLIVTVLYHNEDPYVCMAYCIPLYVSCDIIGLVSDNNITSHFTCKQVSHDLLSGDQSHDTIYAHTILW